MNPFYWYPPAETRISPSSFAHAFFRKADDLEKDLCTYLSLESCILASSGRALMTLLLHALKATDMDNRDEVLIPAYTCYSVAASIVRAGFKISLYDLDPHTLRPDMISLKNAAGNRTLAIIYQHLFGIPQPREDFQGTAEKYGIPVIEDAAQGLGGFLNNMPLGSLGDFSIISFGRGKPLPIGEGGALTGKKEALDLISTPSCKSGWVQLIKSMAVQVLSRPFIYGVMERLPLGLGTTVFHPGFGITGMARTMKRLAKNSFPELDALNSHRRAIAACYQSHLDNTRMIQKPEGSMPVFTRFPIFAGEKRISRALYRFGVRRMYPQAIANEAAITKYLAYPGQQTPGAHRIARELVTLPTHSKITPSAAREISVMLREEYHC